jgi:hypothetical protein
VNVKARWIAWRRSAERRSDGAWTRRARASYDQLVGEMKHCFDGELQSHPRLIAEKVAERCLDKATPSKPASARKLPSSSRGAKA